MRASNKTKIAIVCLVVLVSSASCNRAADSKSGRWGVLFPGLPEKITTAKASHNTLYYILKQTHEPLLRKDDGDNLTSRLLDSWHRSVDSKIYRFCPDSGIKFNDRDRFDGEYFREYISSVTALYSSEFSIVRDGRCFDIKFKNNAKGYLDFLTLYENAPTKVVSPEIEDGLGPFRATSVSKSRITLTRKEPVRNGYNEIVIYDYQGSKDARLKGREIADFNRIQSSDVPAWVKKEYRGFDNIRLKSVILVINHPSKRVREAIYNCVDLESFRRAYFPDLENAYDIQNLFPMGVPGALPGKPLQSCNGKMSGGGALAKLANLRDDNSSEIYAVAKKLSERTGVKIAVANYAPTELTMLRSKKIWAYNLLVMAADAVRPEQEAFISPFLRRKKPFLEYPLPHLRSMYDEMASTDDSGAKSSLALKIMDGLAKEFAVIPLFQATGRMYYPKNIKKLEAGKGFLEYPEIAEFRW